MTSPVPSEPGKAFVVVFDVDGTLLERRPGVPRASYDDGEGLKASQVPRAAIVGKALALEAAGFRVHFLTGRSEGVRRATIEQLEAAGFEAVDGRLFMQEAWGGWEACIQYKADHLYNSGAVLHIGDADLDLQASVWADVPFVHVDSFESPRDIDHTFCWICGCTALKACLGGCGWHNERVCTTCAPRPGERIPDASATALAPGVVP